MRLVRTAVLAVSAIALSSGPASGAPHASPPAGGGLPPELAVPAGNELAFELAADGVQIYACEAGGAAPAWAFRAPEAELLDPGGRRAGSHFAGPTWRASDGSAVVGAKVSAATPDPAAIPWLLLRAASHDGRGRMADVTFVQRVRTTGGNPPSGGCDAAHAGAIARVPYRAAYRFFRAEAQPMAAPAGY